jgi:excisionase family DNA binding protein
VTGDLLTARVVAQRLGLSTETVLHYVRTGRLPAFRLPGGAIRIAEAELEQWLQSRATAEGVKSPTPKAAAHNGVSPISLISSPTTDEKE